MFGSQAHRTIYIICILLIAFFMPVSVWMLSAISVVLSLNWLLAGDYRSKIARLKTRRGILMLLMLFMMYLLWLVNTSDLNSAVEELRLKLPLLLFPVVTGSERNVGMKVLYMATLAFICGCVVATGAGFLAIASVLPVHIANPRDLALFVPSIRLSIMLNFAIFLAMWLSISLRSAGVVLRIALTVAAAAMTYFLFRLLSVTGIVILIFILAGTGIYIMIKGKRKIPGLILIIVAILIVTLSAMLLTGTWKQLHNPLNPGVNNPLEQTASGNTYTQYPEETLVENGYLVWMNVCEKELRNEWNRRSSCSYDGNDHAGNELRVTLIRYITFLGLPKDSAAVAGLGEHDIANIENGFANPLYVHRGYPRARAYEIAWELDRSCHGANPSGHSLTQRPEFYRAAWGIIRKNIWTGVGTGDVAGAFEEEYRLNSTPLKPEYRLRAHNQFLTFAVTFGLPGMIAALLLLLLPWLTSPGRTAYPFILFISIIIISMFNDDTLSSFTGAVFFSYFYTLLIITYCNHETQ